MPEPRIHVFIGTKAQYIKTAPLLHVLDERGIAYRLIDSGQHAALATDLRLELGVREPDFRLGGSRDISTITAAIAWSGRLALRLLSGRRLRRDVFGGHGGICVVHGDTPSTLLSTLMARRAGLTVAHIEAGLRSHSLLHPFPEELIRIIVMRLSGLLFTPSATATANLRQMRVRGSVVQVSANTNVEALARSLPELPEPETGPVVATTHRVENLKHRDRLHQFVEMVIRISHERPLRFVMHGPTRAALEGHELITKLEGSPVELAPLQPHQAFTRMLASAPYVITDGGSIQEECALLGVPTLLWRARTERDDGLGQNVVLSEYDAETIDAFISDHARYRCPAPPWDARPSAEIADVLVDRLRPAPGDGTISGVNE